MSELNIVIRVSWTSINKILQNITTQKIIKHTYKNRKISRIYKSDIHAILISDDSETGE